VDACLHSKQVSKAGSNTFKKHAETMYVSQLRSLTNAKNESKILNIFEKEFKVQSEESRARSRMMETMQDRLGRLIETQAQTQAQQATQQLAFSERFASLMEKMIPKKSAFEVYEENKKRIDMMLENGDIDRDEANLLLQNIKKDLLNG
jgi:predicted nucleotidyltransferase